MNSGIPRLDERLARLREEVATYIGYPVNAAFDYAPLLPFLKYPVNNIGDPFAPEMTRVNTHEFEREVVQTFAELTRTGDVWGYVTTGGSEGNLYGLFLARERFPDGIAYYSADSHGSIAKALRLLRVRGVRIESRTDGAIDLDDFREQLKGNRDVPAIVVANIGTTMKGAIDDVAGIRAVLAELGLRHHVHADAALSGMILPFADDAPPWDFRAGVDSIAVSGHKMIGAPIPCGVVLTRREHAERVEYTTIPGSRNGIAPLFLWYAWRTIGAAGFRRTVKQCLETADYAIERLHSVGRNPWRHPHSPTVVFERPPVDVLRKWQLAAKDDIAHLVAMPHVTREQIDQFIADTDD